MLRNSCKGCEYSQKCELVKMTKEERKIREEIEEEIKKYIGGNNMESVNEKMEKSINVLKEIEETIQKAEAEESKIKEHLNYLYKEYYTTSKNIQKLQKIII